LDALRQSSTLAVGKMLFGLRENLDNAELETCLKALRSSALCSQDQASTGRRGQRQMVRS